MDGLGERVFTLLSSVNHFYWTFFQASSGQGAYTRTHFESDPSSSRQRDSHCGKRGAKQGKERWVTPRGIPVRKQVLLSHVRPVWLIHLRLFNQGSRVNGLWRKMTSILRYWVGQSKSPKAKKKSKNRGDVFLIGHWLSIPGVFLSVKGTLSFLNKHGAIRTKS